MVGRYNGAAALIKDEYPKALYVHCASHRCVTSSYKIITIKNMMCNINAVSNFFNNSSKHSDYLKTNIVQIFPKEKHAKIIDPCRTRWIERLVVALNRFQELHEAILVSSENIYKNIGGGDSRWNEDSKKNASALLNTCSDFGFIITLVIAQNVLLYTHATTAKLQTSEGDIVKGYNEIELIKGTLQNTVRKHIKTSFI